MTEFDKFKEKSLKELEPLRFLFERGIPSETLAAEKIGLEVERWYTLLVELEAQSKSYVADIRLLFLQQNPKKKDHPDMDRRAAVEVATAQAQEFHDQIVGYRKAIEQRLSYIQSILKTRSLEWRSSTK